MSTKQEKELQFQVEAWIKINILGCCFSRIEEENQSLSSKRTFNMLIPDPST